MGFKKRWKNWPYWLKGGTISIFIPIFFILILDIESLIDISNFIVILFIFLNFWLFLPIEYFTGCIGDNCLRYVYYFSFILVLIEFFIIGAIIGSMIGKIRSKKVNMKIKYRKGQGAIEFIILVGFIFFIFVAFLLAIRVNISDKTRESVDLEVKEIALIVQDEIALAAESSDGYYRNFELPVRVANRDYEVNVTGGLVFVRTVDGRHALSLSVLNVTGDVQRGNNIIRKVNGSVILNG